MPRRWFRDLSRQACGLGYELERVGDEYLLWSNEREPGVVRCCANLTGVAEELADIRAEEAENHAAAEAVLGCPRCGYEWPHAVGPPCPECGY